MQLKHHADWFLENDILTVQMLSFCSNEDLQPPFKSSAAPSALIRMAKRVVEKGDRELCCTPELCLLGKRDYPFQTLRAYYRHRPRESCCLSSLSFFGVLWFCMLIQELMFTRLLL